MHDKRFFDHTLRLIESDQIKPAVMMLAGQLFAARHNSADWPATRQTYLHHRLHEVMLTDPCTNRCVIKPRGYAGDAETIDLIYNQEIPSGTSPLGGRIYDSTIGFPVYEAVRLRREHSAQVVADAARAGHRILSLACGHFREGDGLSANEVGRFTLVDQDELSLGFVRTRHGTAANCVKANVFSYLRGAISRKERFDLVYTLGLTDYLDSREMKLLFHMVKAVLAPHGTFLLANFVPAHLAIGWMEAVMDWHLIYREEADLAAFAAQEGMTSETWLDPTGSIAWCRARI